MKKLVSFILAITLITSMCICIFADGIDGPKTSGTPARTTPSDWAKEDVEMALELGILDKDKTYYYGSFITREEFCELIDAFIDAESKVYALGGKDFGNPFVDTDNPAVVSLYIHGIINGKGEKIFAPDDFLTREEAAVIFSRVFSLYPDVDFTQQYFEYDDEKDISSWAKNAVQIMSNTGIMEGYSGGVFYPKSILSTEEALSMTMRFYRYIHPETSAFADNLNSKMPTDKNYMFSPLSIKMSLALAANGAEGETKEDILNTMLINDLDEYNEYSKKLIEKYSESDMLSLNVANSVWVNIDNSPFDFKEIYKETVSEFYGAEAGLVNNKNAVDNINGWVNKNTGGKIPSIIQDADFWAVLVNAIYFKGTWKYDFPKNATKSNTFHSADGTTKEIDFMNQTDYFAYSNTNNTEIVKMPYETSFYTEDENGEIERKQIKDTSISMYLIKSDVVHIEKLLQEAYFKNERLILSVPKFEIEYSEEITKYLDLDTATSKTLADFSAMMKLSPEDNMWIDKILHKTYISIDEEGTEAAAVSASVMEGAMSIPSQKPIEVKFDEPFYFVIRDDINGEILFMGRYAFAE